MNIYKPYFHIIQDNRNGMYYAGAKWGQDANPNVLLVQGGYLTSSNVIIFLIEKFGFDIFTIRKIRLFETAEDACNYETNFLVKVNAAKNEKFYNGHNNTGICNHNKMKQLAIEAYGAEYYFQTDAFKESKRTTSIRKYATEDPSQSKVVQEKHKNTHMQRYGVEYSMQCKEIKEKCRQTNLRKLGVKEVFESDDFKEKAKKTNLEKYGTEHACQSELVKKKKKETRRKLLFRDIVIHIRIYKDRYKLKLGPNWSVKSNDYLENLLQELILKYGNLT